MDRRRFLQLGAGGVALVAAPAALRRDPALAQPAPGPFGHGVASGDPLPDRVVLWTRVTPNPQATPGSGHGGPVRVEWEVATDPGFGHPVASGAVTTTAARDHTVKVDAAGLPAATDLWYRFRALGATSTVGRTRTAPAAEADVDRLRVGVVSCSHYESGYFSAYRHLAERDDLDLVVHLGDYIYEGGRGDDGVPGRGFHPEHEIVALADYRRRHALYKTDADLQALHARHPVVTTIDDHEVTNNSWAGGAGNHQPAEGDYAARRAAAMQAYAEWMPIRSPGGEDEPERVYRHLGFGALADLFLLDGRTYRSRQVEGLYEDIFVTDPAVADPARTMLGGTQRAWLEEGLAASGARWRLLANPVMFAPLILADLPDIPELTPVLEQALAEAGTTAPIVLNGDQWDGYRAEQRALTERFGEIGGVVILTGDIHSSWAAEIPADPGTYLPVAGGVSNAVEFVTPAVTSDAFSAVLAELGIPGGEVLGQQAPLLATTGNPWFKYVEVERHGFGVLDVTAEAAQYDWLYVTDRTDPRSGVEQGPSWRTPAGTNRLEPAAPLGPRSAPSDAPSRTVAAPAAGGAGDVAALDAAAAAAPAGALPATGGGAAPALAAGAAVAGLAAAAAARRAHDAERASS